MKISLVLFLVILLIPSPLINKSLLPDFLLQQQIDKNNPVTPQKKYPKRLKRSESFFGVHFDFHADKDCSEVGKNTSPEMVESILLKVKPDFIQIDCKGHPGLSSYPTKAGNPAPGIIGDPLKIWREVTAKHGVALYMHYSGVFDRTVIEKDSTLARINSDGLRDKTMTSVFGSYVDSLLIPQFKELSGKYNVDGVWVDGDCWAVANDYSQNVINSFQNKYGTNNIPRKKGDPNWYEFCDFNRDGYKKYVKHYVDELHKYNPDFQVASNWAYSSFMPEPVDINVDFISGDFNYLNSVNSARFEGRCIANQGKPWDLMAWGFVYKGGLYHNYKSSQQLIQEASVVMALGGGFQAYFTQDRDGSVALWKMNIMQGVSRFCRERQEYCQYSKAVPQVALLFPKADFYRKINSLYGGWNESPSLKGLLYAILDNQYSTQILSEHHLSGNMSNYPIMIIPEIEYLEPSFKNEIIKYIEDGGNVLVVGQNSADLFKDELAFNHVQDTSKMNLFWLEQDELFSTINAAYRPVILSSDSKPFGIIFRSQNPRLKSEIAGSIRNLGKGKIAAIYFDLGIQYFKGASYLIRNYLNNAIRELFAEPLVEIKGSHSIDVSINRIKNKLCINMVNISGFHNSNTVDVFDEIPMAGPLDILIRSKSRPKRITLQPEGTALPFSFKEDKVKLTIPNLNVHSIIVVE